MSEYESWIGRSETRTDRIDPAAAARWLATLDRAAPADGTMPQACHWCLALPDAPTAALGPDGHPRRDDSPDSFLPPVPLPRRMWASSKVEFLAPLRIGTAVERRSTIRAITEKHGASGRLVFVDVAHETLADGQPAVREVQSLVYRDAAAPDAPLAPPPPAASRFDPAGWDAVVTLAPAEPLLFRFSALTFNSHRIHYDLPYAQGTERYRGLVVHGPLTATLLLQLAARELGDNALARFDFRGMSPAIADEPLHLAMRGPVEALELCAFAGDGREVMRGSGAIGPSA